MLTARTDEMTATTEMTIPTTNAQTSRLRISSATSPARIPLTIRPLPAAGQEQVADVGDAAERDQDQEAQHANPPRCQTRA